MGENNHNMKNPPMFVGDIFRDFTSDLNECYIVIGISDFAYKVVGIKTGFIAFLKFSDWENRESFKHGRRVTLWTKVDKEIIL